MADVACLTPESDYSGFLAPGVDEAVKRSALRKLFADPHFNIMDGLDIYVGDYSQPDPMPPGMLAALNHAQALLDPLKQFKQVLEVPAPDQTLVAQVADAAVLPDQSADGQESTAAPSDDGATGRKTTRNVHDHPVQSL